MAKLSDPLNFIVGKKAAGLLDETFGIRTVDDLLRHYPRSYSQGMTVRDEGEELDLAEGEHVAILNGRSDCPSSSWWDPNFSVQLIPNGEIIEMN